MFTFTGTVGAGLDITERQTLAYLSGNVWCSGRKEGNLTLGGKLKTTVIVRRFLTFDTILGALLSLLVVTQMFVFELEFVEQSGRSHARVVKMAEIQCEKWMLPPPPASFCVPTPRTPTQISGIKTCHWILSDRKVLDVIRSEQPRRVTPATCHTVLLDIRAVAT